MPIVKEYWEQDPNRNTKNFDRNKHLEITTKAFWNDINDSWKFIINCKEHLEILRECKEFADYKPWITNTVRAKKAKWSRFGKMGFHGRMVAFPNYETFPTFMKWFDQHKDTYGWQNPEIRLLKSGSMIVPHTHDKNTPKYIYNMSINHPEGCRFGVQPNGQVPYTAGDVYRINSWNVHCVWNNSDVDRYHVVLGSQDD